MGASPLVGFLELDGGASIVEFCGPTLATRLAQTCKPLTMLLPQTAVERICASLLSPQLLVPKADTLLDSNHLASAVEHVPSLKPEKPLLDVLCNVLGGPPGQRTAHLDQLYVLLAHGICPGPAAIYARAVGRLGLAALLERCAQGRAGMATEANLTAPPSVELFFEDIFAGKAASVILALAAGVDVNAVGPRIFSGDLGCCRWSPLAAAAEESGRRTSCQTIVALLLLARADCNRACSGPCGLTPLMYGARGGSEEACTLLVRAGADVRSRHSGTGCTALDMGTQATARAIRAEREARSAAAASTGALATYSNAGDEGSKKTTERKATKLMRTALANTQVSAKSKMSRNRR